jgi:hypothetical protein
MNFYKSSLVLLALILLGPVNVVSADADSNLNKELDFVRVVHNQKALEASKAKLAKTIFLAQPTVFDPIANGWIAFDSTLKIVGRGKNFRVPGPFIDVQSKSRNHRIGSIGGECSSPFLGMSACSKLIAWSLNNEILASKEIEASGFRLDFHDLKYVETRKSWLGLEYTLRGCSESPTLCKPLDKQFADCEVVEVSASTGKELNRWSASDHISGDEVGWKKWRAGLGGPDLPIFFDPSGSYSDPFHCNSLDFFPSPSEKGVGQIMLSMRHTDSLYALNWPEGKIVWKLGGKPSPSRLPNCERRTRREGALLGGQHDARYVSPLQGGGFNISVFDNGNNTKRAARALLVQIRQDFDCYKIKTVFRDPTNAKSYCTGSFRVLDDGYGIAGWGCSTTGATLFGPNGNPIVSTSVDVTKSGWAIGSPIPELRTQLSYRVLPVRRSFFKLVLPETNQ